MGVHSLAGTSIGGDRLGDLIWPATQEDIPWLLELAKLRYPSFDVEYSEKWLRNWVGKRNIIAIRGEISAAIASISYPFWLGGKGELELEFIASLRPQAGAIELLKILRHINELKKKLGFAKFYLGSRLEDISPLAKRLKADYIGKEYVLED